MRGPIRPRPTARGASPAHMVALEPRLLVSRRVVVVRSGCEFVVDERSLPNRGGQATLRLRVRDISGKQTRSRGHRERQACNWPLQSEPLQPSQDDGGASGAAAVGCATIGWFIISRSVGPCRLLLRCLVFDATPNSARPRKQVRRSSIGTQR